MFKTLPGLIGVLSAYVGSGKLDTAVDGNSCLPWTYHLNSTTPCQCGSSVQGTIKCNITASELTFTDVLVCDI